MPRRRLDAELVRRGLATNRAQAQEAVRSGSVRVSGVTATKAATMVADDASVQLEAGPRPYVSRGGGKLAAALDRFGVDPAGRSCLDAGASTGGFTDCLLQRGASRVVSVDVGYGQLSWGLRNDPRVVLMERTNVRELAPGDLPYAPQIIVADLSFISLRLVLPALTDLAADTATFILLVKPQFEARSDEVGKGGVVRDPEVWRRVLREVTDAAAGLALGSRGAMPSPLPGPAGNVEFLLCLLRGERSIADIEAAVIEGEGLRP